MSEFIQTKGQDTVDKINEQIATILVEVIDEHIDLEKTISEDLNNRYKSYQEAYNSCKDEDLKQAMQEPKIEFNTIKDKLDYAYSALINKWLIITHDINQNWLVTVRIYKEESTKRFLISSENSTTVTKI